MSDREPNVMKCDCCGKEGDFKDQYKSGQLFHKCDGATGKRIGTWNGKRDDGK